MVNQLYCLSRWIKKKTDEILLVPQPEQGLRKLVQVKLTHILRVHHQARFSCIDAHPLTLELEPSEVFLRLQPGRISCDRIFFHRRKSDKHRCRSCRPGLSRKQ